MKNMKKFVKDGRKKRKMNRILYSILKKQKERQYIKYIEKHQENIKNAFEEMVMCPDMSFIPWEFYHVDLYEQILKHDNSKYKPEEFDAYRKNFYPVNEEEKELNKDDFEKAWKHHWESNRHHWECREYDNCEDGKLSRQQTLDCLENVLDWMAMGYQFNDRPYQFYEKNKDKIKLPQAEKDFIEKVIYEGIDKKYIK